MQPVYIKNLLVSGILLSTLFLNAQPVDSSLSSHEMNYNYKQKSEKGTFAGLVLLGGGIAFYINGELSSIGNILSGGHKGKSAGTVIGPILIATSIPVLIIAAENKKRSRLFLRQEKIARYNFNKTQPSNMALVFRIAL